MKRMHRYPRLIAMLGAGVLLPGSALCAGSQNGGKQVWFVDGDRIVRMEAVGEVEFTDDDMDVLRIIPGGRLSIEEHRQGRPTYKAEFTPAGGELDRKYFVGGTRRETDAVVKTWLSEIMPEVARESAIGADRRVHRLVSRYGIAGALREIGRTRSDGAKSTYYALLLRRFGLNPESMVQVLEAVGRNIRSDGDKRLVLTSLAGELSRQPTVVMRAFFTAVESIGSNGDRAHVLTTVLQSGKVSSAVAAAALRTAIGIQSDGDKAAVLLSTPRGLLAGDTVRRSYLHVTHTIRSPSDCDRVLAYLTPAATPR